MSAAAPSFTKRPGHPYGMPVEDVDALIMQTYKNRPHMLEEFGKIFFASEITQSFSAWFNTLSWQASGHGAIKTAESLRDEDLTSDLSKIHVPTGIFYGMLDKICPYELAIEIHNGIEDSILFPFEYSGHAVFYDELELFNNKFINFLNM